jgi:hypothetical protein
MRPDPHRPTEHVNLLDHHIRQVRQENLKPVIITTGHDHTEMIKGTPGDTPEQEPSRSRNMGQIQFYCRRHGS